MAEGGEDGDDREQVRAVVEVCVEGAQWGFLGGDEAAVALRGIGLRSVRRFIVVAVFPVGGFFTLRSVLDLREAGSGLHQNVHNRDVGLKGGRVKTDQFHIAEQGTGHKEIGGGAPVALDVESSRGIFLPALYLECDAGAEAPVLRLKKILAALHLAADLDAEAAKHVRRDEHIRDALGVVNMQGRVFRKERQGHQQTGDQLRAAFARDAGLAGKQRALDGERHVDFRSRFERPQDSPEAGHNFGRAFQWSGREGSDAIDFDLVTVSESGNERDHQAGQKARLADVDLFGNIR